MKRFKVLPLTVGIETAGGIATPIVLRGTPLPTKRTQTFSTAADNQDTVDIRIYMGERPIASKNFQVKSVSLKGIPPAQKSIPQIHFILEIDEHCNITATISEEKSKLSESAITKNTEFDLTDGKISDLLEEAEKNKPQDQEELKKAEEDIRRNNFISKAESILRDENKKSSYQHKKIEKTLADLGLAIENNDTEEIYSKTDELEQLLSAPSDLFANFDLFSNIFSQPSQHTSKTTQNPSRKIKATTQKTTTKSEDHPSVGPLKHNIGKIFGGHNFTLDPNLCFILMPFAEEMRPIYDDHIRPIVESEGISCLRADEIVGVNLITFDIWEKINRARFIIADLTGQNPNVFYELGLAHALGKEVILLAQSIDDVPFDLKAMRCIIYSYHPRGVKNLEKSLQETIKKIMTAS